MQRGPQNATLYIANIADKTTEQKLSGIFNVYGRITRCEIKRGRRNKSRLPHLIRTF